MKKQRIVLSGVGGPDIQKEPRFDTAMDDKGVWMRQVGRGNKWRFVPWDEVFFGSRITGEEPSGGA